MKPSRSSLTADDFRLGLEVAIAVAVEAALAEPQPAAQHLLEHLTLEGADGRIGLGQLVVGAGMLPQDRQRTDAIPGDLGLDPAVVEQVGQLDEPAFPLLAAHLAAIHLREAFGDPVAELVAYCSEAKVDVDGKKRPWIDRKRDHLAAVAMAPASARAVVLADKLHNLLSIRLDLAEGRPVWECFNASKDQVLWYHGAMIEASGSDDPRLASLADECRTMLAEVAAIDG